MEKYVRIAMDAMGGDNAPSEPVKAAVKALETISVCGYDPKVTQDQSVTWPVESESSFSTRGSHTQSPYGSCSGASAKANA